MAQKTKQQAKQGQSSWPFMRKVQWGTVIVMVVMSELVFFAGHTLLSYAIDVVAVAAFFWIRKLRES